MELNKNFIFKRILPIVGGAAIGFAYYYYIGCNNGCAIQSNPYLSTLYGALLGFTFSIPTKKKKEDSDDNQ